VTAQPAPRLALRVVFDTNTVVSALVFTSGRLAWLRSHWREGCCVPLVSRATATELTRVLAYAKLRLTLELQLELQADYLPYCQMIEPAESCPACCRDLHDQPFLDLAHSGKAALLITGDDDLLALSGQTRFAIETPDAYLQRITSGTR